LKDWERIHLLRKDITSYVVHLIRERIEENRYIPPYEVLKEILKDGYFRPGFGTRISLFKKRKGNTIKGRYPAVCFTEQPLNFILISNEVLGSSKHPLYGIAVKKEYFYDYGGRPVIYGDNNLLGKKIKKESPEYNENMEIYGGGLLHTDIHYLWVGYDPTSHKAYGGYTLDWTHEREWRCKSKKYHMINALWNIDGVPILLPYDYWNHKDMPDFKILVHQKEEVNDLKKLISEIRNYSGQNKWLETYFKRLPKAKITSFEEVKEHLDRGEDNWSRIETVPFE
jgi:hypothetical protein